MPSPKSGKKTPAYIHKGRKNMAKKLNTPTNDSIVEKKTVEFTPDMKKLIAQLQDASLCTPNDSLDKDVRTKVIMALNCPNAFVQGQFFVGDPGTNHLIYPFNMWTPFHNLAQARALVPLPWRVTYTDGYGERLTDAKKNVWFAGRLTLWNPDTESTIIVTDPILPAPENSPLRMFALASCVAITLNAHQHSNKDDSKHTFEYNL